MTFKDCIERTRQQLLHNAKEVDTGHWQGVPTAGKPDLVTKEILNVSFLAEMPVRFELEHLQRMIEPSLPWADDHFAERVSRVPSNPGEQYKNWPWWRGQDGALTHTEPNVDERTWAYLAGLVDGDGYINLVHPTRPRIVIGQKDPFIFKLQEELGVGRITLRQAPAGANHHRWTIAEKGEVAWVLNRIEPYLRLKQSKARDALTTIGGPLTFPKGEPKFSHTYQERMWPTGHGIRFPYHNLDDLVSLLLKHPYTRQAYLPMFGFEDTGAVHGRVPCSLGWHFMLREGKLDLWYIIRSCDYVRHFRDDLYLSARLLLWVLQQLQEWELRDDKPQIWIDVDPGNFHFHCFSMHYHRGDEHLV